MFKSLMLRYNDNSVLILLNIQVFLIIEVFVLNNFCINLKCKSRLFVIKNTSCISLMDLCFPVTEYFLVDSVASVVFVRGR